MGKGYQHDEPIAKHLNHGVHYVHLGPSFLCFLLISLIFTPFRPLWSHFVLSVSFVDNFTHSITENYKND